MNLGLQMDIPVAVLFAMSPTASGKWDSSYRSIPGCDVWDRERDATQYRGPHPVVAHPPCRLWGKLQNFANGREGERALACFGVSAVRRWGGVLEHPEGSELWDLEQLPLPGQGCDAFGGWTLAANQFHWGHRCRKPTWLYIVGCPQRQLPQIPHRPGAPERQISGKSKEITGKAGVGRFERMHTPPDFAAWLVDVARRCAA